MYREARTDWPYDGWHVETCSEEIRLRIDLVAVLHGSELQRFCLHDQTGTAAEIAEAHPAFLRKAKLIAALVRYMNEGGDVVDLHEAYTQVADICNVLIMRPEHALVAVESTELHGRTFLLPDNSYLRVIEAFGQTDEASYTEKLTADEMRAMYEEELDPADDEI